jgi:hypothetical protein
MGVGERRAALHRRRTRRRPRLRKGCWARRFARARPLAICYSPLRPNSERK